jgi:hypothetical protein
VRCRRILTAIAFAAVSVTALAACDSKIGQAAAVDSHTLTDSNLASYVKPGATPYADQSGSGQVIPKVDALTTWVRNELLIAAITAKGGEPTPAELNAARDTVVGTGLVKQVRQNSSNHGYTEKYNQLLVDQSALLVLLIERVGHLSPAKALQALENGQANSAIPKSIADARAHIDISPRYGTWDKRTLSVSSDPDSGAPDFVTIAPTS